VLDLNAHGIKNAAALIGGWNAWKEAGLPIVSIKNKATSK
jgi:3-mercaptopyruvate sulfurtransferase SseA